MTIADYIRILRARWLSILLLTLVTTALACGLTAVQTPRYEASCQLFVAANPASGMVEDIGQLSQAGTFAQQRVRSYADLVTSPRVLEPVIKTLSLSETTTQLQRRIRASNPLDTVLIEVTVEDTSATRAADIANEIARRFPSMIEQLERPEGRTLSPVSLSVTRSATPAKAPTTPRVDLYLALGALVGLAGGAALALLRETLDRTVNGRTELAELTGRPVLGTVAADPRAQSGGLVTATDTSARAEAYRQLRTNIRYLSVDRCLHSLVVTGSVPGEGKTTTAANLAVALARAGEAVALVDADLRRPACADLFALPAGVGLTSVLIGEVLLPDALQLWQPGLPLQILTAGPPPPNPSELLSSERMAGLIGELTGAGYIVVIDSPPLLPVTDAAVLARSTDGALLVVRARSTRSDQVLSAVDALTTVGATLLGTVLTHATGLASPYHVAPLGEPEDVASAPLVPVPRRRQAHRTPADTRIGARHARGRRDADAPMSRGR